MTSIWGSVHLLLASAVMTVHPLAMDVLGLACQSYAEVQKDVGCDASANIKQKLMMAPILLQVLCNPETAQKTLKTAPQVVKVATHAPPKPQPSNTVPPLVCRLQLHPGY